MDWILLLFLSAFLGGCTQDQQPNDTYIVENIELEYETPSPYYETDLGTD